MIKQIHRKIALITLITAVFSVSNGLWAQSKVGTTAAPFLGISVSPRAGAMGDAFTALGLDASALYYNPGAISRSGKSQILVSHTNWLVGSNFNWIGFILNVDGQNAFGISLTQLDYGDDEVTTTSEPEGTGEFWTAGDMAISFTYARNLTDRFSIGGSLKYITQSIWHEKSSAVAMDVGLLFISNFNDLRIGMSISNFGGDMRMDGNDLYQRIDLDLNTIGHNENIVGSLKTDYWPLPLFFRVGLAMDVLEFSSNKLTVAVDALRPSDNVETVNVGAEFCFQNLLFLRGGYKSLFLDDSESGLTMGFGANVNMGTMNMGIDYTFASWGLFEDVHMIAIGMQF
ncbi:PorV/PorQ family protein [bacterium]|nr:PorV/PorQ family protein [bacterium]